jgi:hypothetical protein
VEERDRYPGGDLLDELLEILTENRHCLPETSRKNERKALAREVQLADDRLHGAHELARRLVDDGLSFAVAEIGGLLHDGC